VVARCAPIMGPRKQAALPLYRQFRIVSCEFPRSELDPRREC
jgi:hypothetical protein